MSAALQIAPACGANFPSAVLQQDMEDQLRDGSIAVSHVHIAGLATDIGCQAAGARALSVQQCLSLSQGVFDASAANGQHFATTWRNCQSYTCRQYCVEIARSTQRTLIRQLIPIIRALIAKSQATVSHPALELHRADVAAIRVAYPAASKPMLKPNVIFYSLYILTCMALLLRWQWCR